MFFPALLICFPRLPPPGGAWQGRGGFNCSFQLATKTCHPELCPSRAEGREVSAPPTAYPTTSYLTTSYLTTSYPTTSIPMERAVPRTLLIAASIEAAFRSGSFCLAMSSTCFAVTLPTLSLVGAPDPFAMPAARFSRIEAGGVFVLKVNDRSL